MRMRGWKLQWNSTSEILLQAEIGKPKRNANVMPGAPNSQEAASGFGAKNWGVPHPIDY